MKLLLDTHIFIWLDTAPEKLPPTVLHACQDTGNTLYLSVVSVWEMLIKQKLGKLELNIPIEEMLETHQNACLVTADTQIKQYTDQINLLW